jgi:RNA polymerase sigma factor (sigma-70 family)
MPPPPPAEGFASRIFLGPALRTQPDRRLVSLVRQGYELAFEEIVRRYDKALGRYAAAIVPRHRAEDVTQDAFSKALLALRDTEAEIELRPWLYRIVRNTALNDLRDQPAAEALDETLPHLHTTHEEAVRREELRDLMSRLRALPEPQRAAIVMRELEGLSHEEIAAALGLSGGGARQTIYRARRALRDGAGLLVPMPFLKALLAGGAVADGAGVAGAGGAALAGGSAGGGAAMALKTAAATVLVAGTVGTGVALQERGDAGPAGAAAAESSGAGPGAAGSGAGAGGAPLAAGDNRGPGGGGGSSGGDDRSASSGPGGGEHRGGSSGPGSDDGGGAASLGGEDHSGSSGSSGSGISGGGDDGHSGSGSPSSGPGSGGSGETSGGSSNSGPGGGGGEATTTTTTTTSATAPQPIELESSNSGPGSSGSGSGSSGGSDDLPGLPD